MTSPIRYIRRVFKAAARSIAFLPLPMMLAGLFIGAGLYYFEMHTDLSREITSSLPSVVLSSQDTARNVLGLFIAGLMTLMVFTFTQMMSLFNQVANSYSPRLLPYFTGDRSLQFTMGFYIGTIVLNLIVLLSIRSDDNGYVPNISVLISMFFGVVSLMLFIYFVSRVSSKIQANNIISLVFKKGMYYLEHEELKDNFFNQSPEPITDEWQAIESPLDGYLGIVDHHQLSTLAKKYGTRFYIGTRKGDYVPRGFPIIESERALGAEQVKEVLRAVSPVSRKYGDWYRPLLDLLVEIAQRAMSPGINDPRTALSAIDRIGGMLGHVMFIPDYNFMKSENGGEVWLARHDFATVLTNTFSRLRNYCREDVEVMTALLRVGFQLYAASGNSSALKRIIDEELLAVVADARAHIANAKDRQTLVNEILKWRAGAREMLEETGKNNEEEISVVGVPIT